MDMFVVHTVSELEEALKVSANEILVTGPLVVPVQAACQRKSRKDSVMVISADVGEEIVQDINEIFEMCGIPEWERDAMLLLVGNYNAIDTIGNHRIPCAVLKRINKH